MSSKEKSEGETVTKLLRGYWKHSTHIFWRKLGHFEDDNPHKSGRGEEHSNQLNQLSQVTIFLVL